MTSLPSISVVIPAYNAEQSIDRAITSVLEQTYQPIEIIVVDDGSTDRTAAVVRKHSTRVRLLTRTNGGPAAARNLGIAAAKGDWLALLDADDVWFPHKLERQLDHISPAVGIISFRPTSRCRHSSIKVVSFEELWNKNSLSTSSVLIRASVLLQAGGFDEDPTLIGVEDYNLWLRVARSHWKIVEVCEDVFYYLPTAHSLSRQSLRFARAELRNVDKLGGQFGLDPLTVRSKRLAIMHQYGRELFFLRDFKAARTLFSQATRIQISASTLCWWFATHLPRRLFTFVRWLRNFTFLLKTPRAPTNMT